MIFSKTSQKGRVCCFSYTEQTCKATSNRSEKKEKQFCSNLKNPFSSHKIKKQSNKKQKNQNKTIQTTIQIKYNSNSNEFRNKQRYGSYQY